MATLRSAEERLRDQRRREMAGWYVIIAGAVAATALFSGLVAHFGW